jgi:hypothetical protein
LESRVIVSGTRNMRVKGPSTTRDGNRGRKGWCRLKRVNLKVGKRIRSLPDGTVRNPMHWEPQVIMTRVCEGRPVPGLIQGVFFAGYPTIGRVRLRQAIIVGEEVFHYVISVEGLMREAVHRDVGRAPNEIRRRDHGPEWGGKSVSVEGKVDLSFKLEPGVWP